MTMETVDQCYEDMKLKLTVWSSEDEISATILEWYIKKRHALPRAYLMNSMVRLFICWLNKEEQGDQCITLLSAYSITFLWKTCCCVCYVLKK